MTVPDYAGDAGPRGSQSKYGDTIGWTAKPNRWLENRSASPVASLSRLLAWGLRSIGTMLLAYLDALDEENDRGMTSLNRVGGIAARLSFSCPTTWTCRNRKEILLFEKLRHAILVQINS